MKIINPFSFKKQFSLEYASSINDGIYLLSKFVTTKTFNFSKFDEFLKGKISPDKIEIFRVPDWASRRYRFLPAAFYGKFENINGKTVLTGEFRLHKTIKPACIILFSIYIAFWVYIAIRDHDGIALLFGLLGGLLVYGLFILCSIPKFIKEMETIEQKIRNILTKGCI
jgi:hypothetical protein